MYYIKMTLKTNQKNSGSNVFVHYFRYYNYKII